MASGAWKLIWIFFQRSPGSRGFRGQTGSERGRLPAPARAPLKLPRNQQQQAMGGAGRLKRISEG